ncbi:MAG: prephenate dehydrogenase/arogenate dehydrogenase family protein [Spirochaetaceae bacterium]|nr:MAG: prephenate dehydrogenase/arogenate dehydrogenase family protein [Spirochaetaceae bacterium]
MRRSKQPSASDSVLPPEKSLGVYGLGRFGRFYAELLSRHNTVKAFNRNPDVRVAEGIERVDEAGLCDQPVIILCVAISGLQEVLRRIAPRLKPGTLVMDTCSVKTLPSAWMEELLPPDVRILATHPMFGPDSAQGGIAGLPMILHPVRLSASDLSRWQRFFENVGLSVQVMEPELHDREAAFTQGLTHYLGRVLAELQLEPSRIASLGYRKLLDIIEQTCNDSWQLFYDLQQYNPYTREMRERLTASLGEVKRRLDEHPRS